MMCPALHIARAVSLSVGHPRRICSALSIIIRGHHCVGLRSEHKCGGWILSTRTGSLSNLLLRLGQVLMAQYGLRRSVRVNSTAQDKTQPLSAYRSLARYRPRKGW
jgi:hypothetical protein